MSRAAKIFLPAAFLLLFAFSVPAKNPADYQIGDTADADIATPVALTVIDRDTTEVLRQQSAERIPAIFRFDPQSADTAVAAFQKSFAAAREQFLAELAKQFPDRKFDDAALAADDVQKFLGDFAASQSFPADAGLLALWTKGDSGDAVANVLAAKLREAMAQYIRPNAVPPDLMLSGQHIKILADDSTIDIPRAQLHPLGRARTNFLAQFPAERAALGRVLSGFVQPNCTPEIQLTRASRAQAAANILAADHYEAGQILVKRGEMVTAKIKAALDEMRARTPIVRTIVRRAPVIPDAPEEPSRWPRIFTALVLPLGFIAWRIFARRKNSPALAIATTDDWRQRALEAERRADRATAIVRADLTSQLAKTLTNDLVKNLVAQRDDLLDDQQQAADGIAALAERLEKMETTPAKEYYEHRIADLEKELATKTAENRTLLEARIEIVRRQMAEARRVDLN